MSVMAGKSIVCIGVLQKIQDSVYLFEKEADSANDAYRP
jgi:hypothetical protein